MSVSIISNTQSLTSDLQWDTDKKEVERLPWAITSTAALFSRVTFYSH